MSRSLARLTSLFQLEERPELPWPLPENRSVNQTQKRYGVNPFEMESPPVAPPKEFDYALALKNAKARIAEGLFP